MISCDPGQLLSRASCFCLTEKQERQILTYLYCQLNTVGGFGLNLVPTGSTYTGSPAEFDLIVAASTTYTITWGANELSMTLCGVSYPSTGAGTVTIVHTGTCTLMQFFGTFAGTTVTARVKVATSGEVPIPSGFSLSANASGQTLAKWSSPPSNVAQTEVWTSPDNVTFSLAGIFTKPATSGGVTSVAVGSFQYVKIRWIGATLTGAFTSVLIITGRTIDWAKRVVTNGGAIPSDNTISATNTFDQAVVAAGLASKVLAILTFPPDNLVAALTPLYKAFGSDPWTNHNFVAGNLTVNGLSGNGTTRFLDSGFNPTTGGYTNNNECQFLYMSTAQSNAGELFGVNVTALDGIFPNDLNNGALTNFYSENKLISVAPITAGFYLNSRVAVNDQRAYYAKSTTPWAQVGSNLTNQVQGLPNGNLYAFAVNNGAAANFSNASLSCCGMAFGLTSAQGQALFNAVQALRTAFGGGFV